MTTFYGYSSPALRLCSYYETYHFWASSPQQFLALILQTLECTTMYARTMEEIGPLQDGAQLVVWG